MDATRDFLTALEPYQIWLIGGIIAEVLLQGIKRYLWQPADDEKVEKLIAAALVSLALTLVAGPDGAGAFFAMWVGVFFSAIGYHETTDKLGAKGLWQVVFGNEDLPGFKSLK